MGKKARARIIVLMCVVLIGAMVLAGRLYVTQVVRGSSYKAQANRQYIRPDETRYDRGDIYFQYKNGDLLPAATLKSGYTIAIDPSKIIDPTTVYKKIEPYVDIQRDKFITKASKLDDPYEEIDSEISRDIAMTIDEKDITGVRIYDQKWRYYPGNTMAPRTVGFVAYNENELAGRYGLERTYESILKRDTNQLYVNFFAEVFSNIKDTIFAKNQRTGGVVTHIEPNVQLFLQKQLKNVTEKWNSQMAGGIIMDPRTGEIIAMGSNPVFNLNEPTEPNGLGFKNPLIENVREMGSIFKPITMAIGLDRGVITPETMYTDHGYLEVNGERIENYDGQARGKVNMQEVLNQSLNTGAAYIAEKVGKEQFTDHMLKFGFGEKTNIDLPNETKGLVENLYSPRQIEHITASYGQGIAVSPIVVTRALSVLANGGYLVQPHIADKIVYEIGDYRNISPSRGKQVIDTSTSEKITRMLVTVVDDILANGEMAMDDYAIAAKTGTAQIAKENERGYYEDRFLHSFFGYAPAYDPQFIIFLYTIDPSAQYASQSLTDPFMKLVSFMINYYEIPPDR